MKLIVLLTLILLFACEAPEISIPDYTPEIAVDGYIEAGEPPVLYLTYSSSFIGSYDSLDFVNAVKFNVSAYIITEDNDTIGFMRKTDSSHFPPFRYTTAINDLIGEAGKSYKLLIRKSGNDDITASTTIPLEPPSFSSLQFLNSGDDHCTYLMEFDNNSFDEFAFIQNKHLGDDEYYPIKLPVISDKYAEGETFAYEVLSGGSSSNIWMSTEELDSLVNNGDLTSDTLKGFDVTDTILFKVSSIDLVSYDVLSSLFFDVTYPDNPFKPASYLPVSNVSNNMGRWTGMNSIKFSSCDVNK